MALGVLVVPDEHVNNVRRKFLAMKKLMGVVGEIKWEYVNNKTLARYATLANIALALIMDHKVMQFHSMLICMDVVDHDKHNEGIPDIAYSRFFHHLLLKHLKIYPRERKYRILFDKRESKIPLRPFQNAANFAARNDHGIDHWPFRSLQYADSKSDILLQINDLLLGSVGFLRNAKHKHPKTKDSAKAQLALHIRRRSPVRSFYQDTAAHQTDFTIWALRFDGKKGKEAWRNRKKFKPKGQQKKQKKRKTPPVEAT
jgi:hypothetical protein